MSRLAWAVLLISFALCVGLAIGIPVGIRAYLYHATRPLYLVVRPIGKSLALQPGPRSQTILVRQLYEGIPEESRLELENGQSAVLLAYAQEGVGRPLATLFLHGPLQCTLHSATRPRFARSPDPVTLELEAGYGRFTLVLDPATHPVEVTLTTPQGLVFLRDGTEQVSISSQSTRLEVYSGGATLGPRRASQDVPPGYLGVLGPTSTITLEPAGQALLRNGDFAAGFTDWISFTRRVEPSGSGGARLQIVTLRAALRIWRDASGVGESGLQYQLGGSPVTQARDVRLKALVRIAEQSQPQCGPRGNRCPVTLRLYYRDVAGTAHVWEQGFYSVEGTGPKTCLDCELASPLKVIPLGEWSFFESENLLSLAPTPAYLDAVELAADGERFTVEIDDVILQVKE